MQNLSSIGFAVRRLLAGRAVIVSNGHAQQLVAAAFGHNNLASYQASGDDAHLPSAPEMVIDRALLRRRSDALDVDDTLFATALVEVLQSAFPDAAIRELNLWLEEARDFFEQRIINSAQVSGQTAMTNGTFPQAHVELSCVELDATIGEPEAVFHFNGLVTVDQDPDRVYYGHEVDVEAVLLVERFGRRMFGNRRVEVESAKLKWLGE